MEKKSSDSGSKWGVVDTPKGSEPTGRKRATTRGFNEVPAPPVAPITATGSPPSPPPLPKTVATGPPPLPTKESTELLALRTRCAQLEEERNAAVTLAAFQNRRALQLLAVLAKNELGCADSELLTETLLKLSRHYEQHPKRIHEALAMEPEFLAALHNLFALLKGT